jgi:hypothetical protein
MAMTSGMLLFLKDAQADFDPDQHFEESLAVWQEFGDKHMCAVTLNDLGERARSREEYVHAETYYAESLTLFRELGNRAGIAMVLENLGYVRLWQGDAIQAAVYFREGLAANWETERKDQSAIGIAGMAGVATAQGQPEWAARLLGAADTLITASAMRLASADRGDYERIIAATRTQLGEEAFAVAWEAGRAMTLEQAIAEALEHVGLDTEPRQTFAANSDRL